MDIFIQATQWVCYLWTGLTLPLFLLLAGLAYWAEKENKRHNERIQKMLSADPDDQW